MEIASGQLILNMSRKLRNNDTSINDDDRDQRGRITKQCFCVSHSVWTTEGQINLDEYHLYKIKE